MKTASKKSLKLDRAPAYISKEDAVNIAENLGCSYAYFSNSLEIHSDDLATIINLAIAKVIGEPVYVLTDKLIILNCSGSLHVCLHTCVGQMIRPETDYTPLYAIKELPND